MPTTRVQVVMEHSEQEVYRQNARLRGMSLSAWMREAAREKLASEQSRRRIDGVDELREFFAECDRQEDGTEPSWEQHREVIEGSKRSGEADQ